jgi:hypothetical protein
MVAAGIPDKPTTIRIAGRLLRIFECAGNMASPLVTGPSVVRFSHYCLSRAARLSGKYNRVQKRAVRFFGEFGPPLKPEHRIESAACRGEERQRFSD